MNGVSKTFEYIEYGVLKSFSLKAEFQGGALK